MVNFTNTFFEPHVYKEAYTLLSSLELLANETFDWDSFLTDIKSSLDQIVRCYRESNEVGMEIIEKELLEVVSEAKSFLIEIEQQSLKRINKATMVMCFKTSTEQDWQMLNSSFGSNYQSVEGIYEEQRISEIRDNNQTFDNRNTLVDSSDNILPLDRTSHANDEIRDNNQTFDNRNTLVDSSDNILPLDRTSHANEDILETSDEWDDCVSSSGNLNTLKAEDASPIPIADIENQNEFINCIYCQSVVATRYCEQCYFRSCRNCFESVHLGNNALMYHTYIKLGKRFSLLSVDERRRNTVIAGKFSGEVRCDLCPKTAVRECYNCDLIYCFNCFVAEHNFSSSHNGILFSKFAHKNLTLLKCTTCGGANATKYCFQCERQGGSRTGFFCSGCFDKHHGCVEVRK